MILSDVNAGPAVELTRRRAFALQALTQVVGGLAPATVLLKIEARPAIHDLVFLEVVRDVQTEPHDATSIRLDSTSGHCDPSDAPSHTTTSPATGQSTFVMRDESGEPPESAVALDKAVLAGRETFNATAETSRLIPQGTSAVQETTVAKREAAIAIAKGSIAT
jgi:hypothetical protein